MFFMEIFFMKINLVFQNKFFNKIQIKIFLKTIYLIIFQHRLFLFIKNVYLNDQFKQCIYIILFEKIKLIFI